MVSYGLLDAPSIDSLFEDLARLKQYMCLIKGSVANRRKSKEFMAELSVIGETN